MNFGWVFFVSTLDFKEIPKANSSDGLQDEFELFARDFLLSLGYEIVSEPDRGQDGGKDLIIVEKRRGLAGTTEILWLVSCKHYAHSGKSVGTDDEINISDRVESHGCHGFIGFYSTLPSSGLASKLENFKLKNKFEFQIFHRGAIENELLKNQERLKLFSRYFPNSHQKWINDNQKQASLDSLSQLNNIRMEFYNEYITRRKKQKN